ncbi:hypothetical protein [Pseudomonas fluorescens]|jgi:hypothetical protein|uniref:hypothetical protein n=1 Tax=Pseudomonas fluorescens TaxID=294 RepID=UPI0037F36624
METQNICQTSCRLQLTSSEKNRARHDPNRGQNPIGSALENFNFFRFQRSISEKTA